MASATYLSAMPRVNRVVDSLIAHADYVFDIGLPAHLKKSQSSATISSSQPLSQSLSSLE